MAVDAHSTIAPRRAFLRNLASLPLIGGSLAIIGAPSAPVSLVQAATLSGVADPRERARFAWEAFASAMDDLTTEAHGWRVICAANVRPHGPMAARSFIRLAEVHIGREGEPIVERHREISLDPVEEAVIRAQEAFRTHLEGASA